MKAATPPLVAIMEGRRVRPRKAPRLVPRELELHLTVAEILRRHIQPGWIWSHFPAGEHRDIRTAAKLKAMGVARGWPDLLILSPRGFLHGLELKRQGSVLSVDQAAFQLWSIQNGVPYSVARSVSEALTIFAHWGCLQVEVLRQLDAKVPAAGGAA